MFCFLCKKHNTENKKNKSKAYNATPRVCFKNRQLKNILHLNNTKMPLRQDGLFGAFFFLAAHNNSRRVILDHANSQQHFQFPTQYSIYL